MKLELENSLRRGHGLVHTVLAVVAPRSGQLET